MPVTRAPTARRARTNSRWFLGKAGSTKITCMGRSGGLRGATVAGAAAGAQESGGRILRRFPGADLATRGRVARSSMGARCAREGGTLARCDRQCTRSAGVSPAVSNPIELRGAMVALGFVRRFEISEKIRVFREPLARATVLALHEEHQVRTTGIRVHELGREASRRGTQAEGRARGRLAREAPEAHGAPSLARDAEVPARAAAAAQLDRAPGRARGAGGEHEGGLPRDRVLAAGGPPASDRRGRG